MRKRDLMIFLKWTKNGSAFCTAWFLILLLVYSSVFKIEVVSTERLVNMVLWVIGGVLIFNAFFTRLFFRRWSFLRRLTCFMAAIGIYESIFFYRLGFFGGSAVQLPIFIGIVFILYLICIAIYRRYSKKRGEIYTEALQKYQLKRSEKDGE